REVAFMDTDQHVRVVLQSHVPGLAVAFLRILAGWFAEAGETWVRLRLLGGGLSFAGVTAFEPVVSFGPRARVFIPAGLRGRGPGYMAFFQQAGIPDPVNRAAAFVLLKRFKELVWISVGWILLLATRRRTEARARAPGSAPEAERASS